jgi:hypothetical protein
LDHQLRGPEGAGLFDIEQPRVQRCTCAYLTLLRILGEIARGEGGLDVAAGVRVTK